MIKAIIFDLDGTICDSIPMCIEGFRKAVNPYIDHELSEKEVIQTFGLNEIGMIKAVVKNNWEKALNDFYLEYEKLHSMCMEPFQGIYELLRFIKDNKIIVGLVTGKGEKSCDITLRKLQLEKSFDDVLTGSEYYNNKSDCILLLMKKYSLDSNEIIYIGDAVSDILACKSIGVICLTASWKRLSPEDMKELKSFNSNFIFQSIKDIKEYIVNAIS